jgi:radical SAM protein with 4Fe4S-binding SPASM domain
MQKKGIKYLSVSLAGGEPLYKFDAMKTIVAYVKEKAKQLGLVVNFIIITNGILIKDPVAQFLKDENIGVQVTLDGLQADHDATRYFKGSKQGSYQFVMQGVERLRKIDKSFSFHHIVTPDNHKNLPSLLEFMLANNYNFNIGIVREHTEAAKGMFSFDHTDLLNSMEQSLQIAITQRPNSDAYKGLLGQYLEQSSCFSCSAGTNRIAIDPKGNVSPCHVLLETPLTHIYADDLESKVFDDPLELQVDPYEIEGCNICQWKYICRRACPSQNLQASGHTKAKTPMCSFNQDYYKLAIQYEAKRLIALQNSNSLASVASS